MRNETILAEYILNTSYDELPSDVVRIAKQAIMDSIGVTLAGSAISDCRQVVDMVEGWGGKPESTIIASGKKVPAPMAAMVNSQMSAARELNDGHPGGGQHPATITIPAALAVAESKGLSGREFITAVVLGIEIQSRLGWAVNFTVDYMDFKRWHHTTILGPFGSVTACGKLLALKREQMENAFGLALSQAAGTLQFIVDERQPRLFQIGNASRSGVIAALLACEGYPGYVNSLDGKYGLFKSFFSDWPNDIDRLTSDLGRKYEILDLIFKPWPAGGMAQLPVEAVLQAAKEHDVNPMDVKQVKIYLSKINNSARELAVEPRNMAEAQGSIPFLSSVVLIKRRVYLEDISEENIRDPQILEMANKIEIGLLEPEFRLTGQEVAGKVQAKAEIKLISGKTVESGILVYPYGCAENPMTKEDIIRKFKNCAKNLNNPLPEERVNKLLSMFDNLDEVKDVNEITEMLA